MSRLPKGNLNAVKSPGSNTKSPKLSFLSLDVEDIIEIYLTFWAMEPVVWSHLHLFFWIMQWTGTNMLQVSARVHWINKWGKQEGEINYWTDY